MDEPKDDCLHLELSRAWDMHEAVPEPSEEHCEALRKKIMACTFEQVQVNALTAASGASKASRAHFPLRLSLVVSASILLCCLLTVSAFMRNADASLRSSLDATRSAEWIHGMTTVKHAGVTSVAESWCSPIDRLFAFQSPQLLLMVNYTKGVQASYSEGQGKIIQWPVDQRSENLGRAFVVALLNDGDIKSSMPLHTVSEVRKSVGSSVSSSIVEYTFQVQDKGNPSIRWETRVSTAPETGRIVLWEDKHVGGMTVTTRFEYPAAGPRDIYQMGAPRDAEVFELGSD